MRYLFLIVPLVASCLACGTAKQQETKSEAVSTMEPQVSTPSINMEKAEFSIDFLKTAIAYQPKGNVILSPYSAGVAFSMLNDGARGTTHDGLRKALRYSSYYGDFMDCDSLNIVKSANSVWLNKGFVADKNYISRLENGYNAQTFAADKGDPFTAEAVNTWCALNTEGLIQEILDQIPADVRMMLLNALYFKAAWVYPFDPQVTTEGTFYGESGQTQVKYMQTQARFEYVEFPGYKVVSLPYKNWKYAMMIVLPDDIDAAVEDLTADKYNYLFAHLDKDAKVRVVLPRFKLETTKVLNDLFSSMGAGQAFTSAADFSGITGEPIFVSKALQKCVLEVNEEGSEAAAVTAILMGRTAVPERVEEIIVNKPFFFAIYNPRTREILFEGKIADIQ